MACRATRITLPPLLGFLLSTGLGAWAPPAAANPECIARPTAVCIADMAVAASKTDGEKSLAALIAALTKARAGQIEGARHARDEIAPARVEKSGLFVRLRWAEILARTGDGRRRRRPCPPRRRSGGAAAVARIQDRRLSHDCRIPSRFASQRAAALALALETALLLLRVADRLSQEFEP